MRRRQHRETRDVAKMVGRMINALGRRVTDGDEQDVRNLVALRDQLDGVIGDAVRVLHYEQGFPWSTIGEILGITRQAAQQRFGRANTSTGCTSSPGNQKEGIPA